MKAFLRLTGLFSLLVLLTLGAGEIYVRHLPNPSRDKHEYMSAHSREVEVLVLGSSHTFYGVNPEWLDDAAYSLAQVSQTYRYDDYLLRRYPTPRLRAVIIPFSYFSLYEDFESQPETAYLAARYRIYMDCPYHRRLSRYGFEVLNFGSFKEKLKSLWQPARLSWNSRGWGSNYTGQAASGQQDNGRARARANTYADRRLAPLNACFLSSMFSWCRQRGVRVLLITTPVTPSFRAAESPAQRAENRHWLTNLLRRYPEVEYYDFESAPCFTAADFYDADHLNAQGARRLTSLLRAILHGHPVPQSLSSLPADFPTGREAASPAIHQ